MAPRLGNDNQTPDPQAQLRESPPAPPSPPLGVNVGQLLEGMNQFQQFVGSMNSCQMGIQCDSCLKNDFFGYRYKCAVCENYDLCSGCFEERKTSQSHQKQHPMILLRKRKLKAFSILSEGLEKVNWHAWDNGETHNFSCNPCGNMIPIKGLALICDDCKGGYRMCYDCYSSGKVTEDHQLSHCLILRMTAKDFKMRKCNISINEKITNSNFGQVSRAEVNGDTRLVKMCKTRQEVVKSLPIKELQKLEDQMEILKEFHCEYIVQFKKFNFTQRIANMTYEFIGNQSLGDHLGEESYKEIDNPNRFNLGLSVIRGLYRMHEKGILHKDLKPDKVLLTSYETAKIGDRGFAFDIREKCKNEGYQKSESHYPPNDANPFTPSGDIYAFGLLMNEIMSGAPNVKLTPGDCCDKDKVPYFGDMISACIDADPEKRPSAACIKKHLLAFDDVLKRIMTSDQAGSGVPDSPDASGSTDFGLKNAKFEEAYQSFSASASFKAEPDQGFQENERLRGFEENIMKLLRVDERLAESDFGNQSRPECPVQ